MHSNNNTMERNKLFIHLVRGKMNQDAHYFATAFYCAIFYIVHVNTKKMPKTVVTMVTIVRMRRIC